MSTPPSGTITLLFTDIEGSTRMLTALGERYGQALAEHRSLLREAFARHRGHEVDTQGDAFFVVFATASDAVAAAVEAQRALTAHVWPEGQRLRVRMGLHTGEPRLTDEGYVGLDLHHGARICSAGHGGQILVSEATERILSNLEPRGIGLRDLGAHRLKDLTAAQHLFQVLGDGLESAFPPPRTIGNHATNLPVQPTPLLGRVRELDDVAELLTAGRARLLTLTGPGGTGKTRLALQAAADRLEAHPDGVFVVDLAPVTDAALVGPTIAQSVGAREGPGRTALEALVELWSERSVLLVLDNVEQVVAGASVVAELLSARAGVQVLATSRQPLRIPGEQEYPVPPLAEDDAVALFVARARAVLPTFRLTEDNARDVTEICRRLDGLPLAIELAAARAKVLPPRALLMRLGQRLDLLTGGSTVAPERHQTLRAAIDWSYSLLDDVERRMFAGLAAFDGCTLEAVESVLAEGDGAGALDAVASLVDQSLVRRDEQPGGQVRFSMLATIHEYALERLEADPACEAIRDRHAEYVEEIAGAGTIGGATAALESARLARLEIEHGNLCNAISWRLARGRPDVALDLVRVSWVAWMMHLRLPEARFLIRDVLARSGAADPVIRAEVQAILGELDRFQGDYEAAWHAKEEALPVLRRGNPRMAAAVLDDLGDIASDQGRYDDSRALHEEALSIARGLGDEWGEAHARAGLGRLSLVVGDPAGARRHYDFVLEVGRGADLLDFVLESQQGLAHAALLEGDLDGADRLVGQTLQGLATRQDLGLLADSLATLATVADLRGDQARALTLLGAVAAICATSGLVLYFPDRRPQVVASARARLEDTVAETAWAAGRAMSPVEALAYARGHLTDGQK